MSIQGCRRRILKVTAFGILFFCLVTNLAYALNSSPAVGTLTPSTGTSRPNQQIIFTTTYLDSDGWQNIKQAHFLINTSVNATYGFYAYYNQNTRKLYLINNNYNAWLGGFSPGSNHIIENSYAKLNCASTIVRGSGNTLTISWAVTFKPTFLGRKNIYLYVKDDANAYSAWVQRGTWKIQSPVDIASRATIKINNDAFYTTSANVILNLSTTLSGSSLQMSFSNDNTNWSRAQNYAPTKNWRLTSADGTKTVYAKFRNISENWLSPVSDTIILDIMPPTTRDFGIDGLWHNRPVTISLNAQDAGLGINQTYYSFDGTNPSIPYTAPFTISDEGIYTIKYYSRDNVGHSEVIRTALNPVKIDKTSPYGTIQINRDAPYANTVDVALSLSARDARSGMAEGSQMSFSNDNIVWSEPESYAPTKNWPLSQGEGRKTVYVKFKDAAGNWSTPVSDTIILDTTAPTGTLRINNDDTYTNSTSVTLNLFADDAGGSGLAQMCISSSDINWLRPEAYTTSKTWLLPFCDGTRTVYVKFQDMAGNWSVPYSDSIILDTCPPQGNVQINHGVEYTNSITVNLNIFATDSGSNLSQIQISNDNSNWSDPQDYTQTKTWVLSSGDGQKTVYMKFKDAAGNWSTPGSDTIILDTTAPDLPQGLLVEAGNAVINLSWATNTESDLAGYNIYRLTIPGSGYTKINTALINTTAHQDSNLINDTTYYYVITAVDCAGNESNYSNQAFATYQELFTESEPNNDFSSVNRTKLGSLINGTINPVGDQDYFSIIAPESGKLYIYLTDVPSNIDAYIYLYDGVFKYIASAYSGGNGNNVRLGKEISSAGNYYIRIFDSGNNAYSTSSYNLKVKFTKFWLYGVSDSFDPFSPNSDNLKDSTTITAFGTALCNWTLNIKDSSGNLKRTYTGSSQSIKQTWDGRDAQGQVVADGTYTYTIDAIDPVTGISAVQVRAEVTVDNTPPVVSLSAPLENSTLSGEVDIRGLSDDLHWLSYGATLYYGQGTQPANWVCLREFSNPIQPLVNGDSPIIYTWDTQTLSNGDYVLRLEVQDLVGNKSTVDVPLRIENAAPDIMDLVVTPSPFTPDGLDDDITNDVSQIRFKLSDYGFTTVAVYDQNTNLIKTIWNGVLYPDPANDMQIELLWEGRNNNNQLVRNGEYKVVVSTGGGSKEAFALVVVNNRPIFNNFSVNPTTFSPNADGVNDIAVLNFSLSEDAYIDVEIYNTQETLIRTISQDTLVTAGQLYDFTWEGKDNNNQLCSQGRYFFKVSANALTDNLANPLRMNVYLLFISDIRLLKDTFKPYSNETTAILYQLTNNAKLSIKIYDAQDSLVRNLITEQLKGPGQYREIWDGKDDNGNILPDGYYYFIIEDSLGGTTEVTYDPRGTGGRDISYSIAFLSTNFDTLNNQPAILTYNLVKPAKINIKVRSQRYSGPAIRVIKYQEPVGSGRYQTIWDGRDEVGNIIPHRQYTLAIWGYTLEDNAIVIAGGRPVVSEVSVSPIKFTPIHNPYAITSQNSTTISFNLSKDTYVTLDIYDINNILVHRLLNNVLKSQGINTVVWNGKNERGEILLNGYYRLEIQAEKDGNYSDIVTAHTEVIY